MLQRNEIIDRLKSIKPLLAEKYSVKQLGIFGSYARNEARPESDIDILVEFNKPVGFEFIDLANELESLFHQHVDLVSKRGIKSPYLEFISKDIIYV